MTTNMQEKICIIKAGGKVIEDRKRLDLLMQMIQSIINKDYKVFMIFGGGRAVDEESAARNISVQKIDGLRVTNAETLTVLTDVISGRLTASVTGSMGRAAINGIVFNVAPTTLLDVSLKNTTPVDYGYVGTVDAVHFESIRRLYKGTSFIASSCLGITHGGQLCNINADDVATALAIGLQAQHLLFFSDVDGVLHNGKTIPTVTDQSIHRLIHDGIVTGGMKVKLENCVHALHAGVAHIHLLNGLSDFSLLDGPDISFPSGTTLHLEQA